MTFALDVIRFCSTFPRKQPFYVISGQLIRSATSVAANYRSACRAQSMRAFIAKMSIVEEEADESEFWLGMVDRLKTRTHAELERLLVECNAIVAVSVSSKKTARRAALGKSALVTRHSSLDTGNRTGVATQ
jgi:four helix bundle protein